MVQAVLYLSLFCVLIMLTTARALFSRRNRWSSQAITNLRSNGTHIAIQESKENQTFVIPRIGVIGSGNFGSVMAKLVGENVHALTQTVIPEANFSQISSLVKMWVYEENVTLPGSDTPEKLTEIINTRHENVKYLPNVTLPFNVRAVPDLLEAVRDCNILLFVVPHQFLPSVLRQLQGKVAKDVLCLHCIKGLHITPTETLSPTPSSPTAWLFRLFTVSLGAQSWRLQTYAECIAETLGVKTVGALMGANVAKDLAHGDYAEATVALRTFDTNAAPSEESLLWQKQLKLLFEGPQSLSVSQSLSSKRFRLQFSHDLTSVELCGALKNIYALGGGFCDGLGLGVSSKSALLRQSIVEISSLCSLVHDYQRHAALLNSTTPFYEWLTQQSESSNREILQIWRTSCGLSDLLATAFGGRSRLVSAEYMIALLAEGVQQNKVKAENMAEVRWRKVQQHFLQGQQLQGLDTLRLLVHFLDALHQTQHFPLLKTLHRLAFAPSLQTLGVTKDMSSESARRLLQQVLFQWE